MMLGDRCRGKRKGEKRGEGRGGGRVTLAYIKEGNEGGDCTLLLPIRENAITPPGIGRGVCSREKKKKKERGERASVAGIIRGKARLCLHERE